MCVRARARVREAMRRATWLGLKFSSRTPVKRNFPGGDEMRLVPNVFQHEKRKRGVYVLPHIVLNRIKGVLADKVWAIPPHLKAQRY